MCLLERNPDTPAGSWASLRRAERARRRRRRKRSTGLTMALLLVAFLAQDDLVVVADALALVGLGLAERAQLGGDLPDPLAVGAGDRVRGRGVADQLDVVRVRVLDVVDVAESENDAIDVICGAAADNAEHTTVYD